MKIFYSIITLSVVFNSCNNEKQVTVCDCIESEINFSLRAGTKLSMSGNKDLDKNELLKECNELLKSMTFNELMEKMTECD